MTRFLKRFRKPLWTPVFLAVNTLVFLMWTFPDWFDIDKTFLGTYFLTSPLHLLSGEYFSIVGSVFSHNMFLHFFVNMIVLMNFGPIIEILLGRRRFFTFYILAGLGGSLGHCFVSWYILKDAELLALGASGALSGVILFFALAFPKERLLILGLIPIPALIGALAFVGLDVWGLMAQAKGGGLPIGHGAHLGGALTGVIYFFWERSRIRKRRLQAGL